MEKIREIAKLTNCDEFSEEMISKIQTTIKNCPDSLQLIIEEGCKVSLSDIKRKYTLPTFVAAFSNPRLFCSAFADALTATIA